MPLAGKSQDDAAGRKAAETFARLSKAKRTATETLSFRVPMGERERLRLVFAHEGLTLTAGLKLAVYQYVKSLETSK